MFKKIFASIHLKLTELFFNINFARFSLCFAADILAVPVAYWSFLCCFAWELVAFKAEFDAFCVSTVADLAELVFSCCATCWICRACVFLHSGAFFTSDSTNTNLHFWYLWIPIVFCGYLSALGFAGKFKGESFLPNIRRLLWKSLFGYLTSTPRLMTPQPMFGSGE